MRQVQYLFFLSTVVGFFSSVSSNVLLEALNEAEIAKDLGISFSPDVQLIQVKFNGEAFVPGEKFSKDQVASEPDVLLPESLSADSLYSFFMVDPDAPSRATPVRRSWLHWHVINIKGSDFSSGEVKCSFNPSTPPQGSGFHRYVFTVLKQAESISLDECSSRSGFNVFQAALTFSLGDVLASNFYQAKSEP